MASRTIRKALATTFGLVLASALLLPSTGQSALAVAPAPATLPMAAPEVHSLSFSPVTATKGGSVTATFTGSAIVKNRPVVLKYQRGTTWAKVGSTVKMDSKGKAVFKVAPTEGRIYQASAASYKYKVKGKKKTAPAVVTSTRTIAQDWSRTFTDYFSTGFDRRWGKTLNNNYDADGRWCSAPRDENAKVSGGNAVLTISQVKKGSSEEAQVIKAAKAKQAAAHHKQVGCPNGVFKNVRVSTEVRAGDLSSGYTIKTGVVAAEVTFPKYQGFHGGIWLQSMGGSELDLIEAFGYRKGIQNVLHVGNYDTPEAKKWVAKSAVKKSSWWSKSHVFSIEWTRDKVIFRLDGTVTKTEAKRLPDTDYFIVMSMLSSDWETGRLKKPVSGGVKAKLPASMKVNWIKAWTKA